MEFSANSLFSMVQANVDLKRSQFGRSQKHLTTVNAGQLVPLFIDEVLPGDTISLDMRSAVRMSTPIFPVMDNCFLDIYRFFVPNRLVWDHWKNFQGEQKDPEWVTPTEYQVPQLKAPSEGFKVGTLADYFGIPTGVSGDGEYGLSVNALPFRGYALIYNEWFRDQNLQHSLAVSTDDSTQTGANDGDPVINTQLGALPVNASKVHDYFTSCLPAPQKGPDVLLPLGQTAPIITTETTETFGTIKPTESLLPGVQLAMVENSPFYGLARMIDSGSNGPGGGRYVNIAADLSNAVGATVNQLRQAFAIQRIFEKDARGGTRYREILKSHFGVTSPDATQQIPEYLGGCRTPINMDQIPQTSATNEVSPQGNMAAYSLTNQRDSLFTKSFTEHGFVFVLGVIRQKHTYQQGLERFWSRKSRFDYYMPTFANLGEQPVYNKEIYAQGNEKDNEVFGYQEAWADYRYKPDRVSGQFRSSSQQPLDSWHYADYYESLPMLSNEWIQETDKNIERTLATTTELAPQFICDFAFMGKWSRVMPIRSIPGLLDHN